MATVRVSLNLTSKDVISSSIDIPLAFSLTADSGNLIRSKVLGISQGADAITISKANDKEGVAYLLIRNLALDHEQYATVYEGVTDIMKIAGGQFAFVPVKASITLKCYAAEAGQYIEYAVFGVDSTTSQLG